MANKFLRKYLISEANDPQTIYTVPAANSAALSSLRVTNSNTATAEINVSVFPAGVAGHNILNRYLLPVDATMDVFSGVPLVLEAGDALVVEATEDDVVFWLSYMEMDRN
jgi:hypothetical protein